MALKKRDSVSVKGPWLAMPLEFLSSRACAQLSPHALKMLVDLCSQLKANGRGNGDLSATADGMAARGWSNDASRIAALRELEQCGLIFTTRPGKCRRCNLYAITLWPLWCDPKKIHFKPGCYTTRDWEEITPGCGQPPTAESPAVWRALRPKERIQT